MDDRTIVLDEAVLPDEPDSQVTRRCLIEQAVITRIQGFANRQQRLTKARLERGYVLPGEPLFEVW